MAFRFRVNRRHRKDRQTECNTLSSPYKSIGYTPDCAQPGPVPWLTSLLSSKDSGGSMYIILVIFERLNCTNMGNILVVKKIAVKPASMKWRKRQPSAICSRD